MKLIKTLLLTTLFSPLYAQQPADSLKYKVEAGVTVSNGDYAPVWLTAKRYGVAGNEPNFAYVRAGAEWNKVLPKNWRRDVGLDLAGG